MCVVVVVVWKQMTPPEVVVSFSSVLLPANRDPELKLGSETHNDSTTKMQCPYIPVNKKNTPAGATEFQHLSIIIYIYIIQYLHNQSKRATTTTLVLLVKRGSTYTVFLFSIPQSREGIVCVCVRERDCALCGSPKTPPSTFIVE